SALHSFFIADQATTQIYTLSYTTLFRSQGDPAAPLPERTQGRDAERLHEEDHRQPVEQAEHEEDGGERHVAVAPPVIAALGRPRSEEHTSELQSRGHLVCRLLLEKKNAC